jgi:hypothetical protein
MRARVFISCGQNQNSDEVQIATEIATSLSKLGFDPYIAVQEHSLRGLTDNLFNRLRESEYLVFVDFRRDQLANKSEHRGSLFSHQELAIAAFLGMEVLAFQEAGVLQLDGMIRFLQANAFPFTDRASLPDIVRTEVLHAWTPGWRKTLSLTRDPTQFVDADSVDQDRRPAGVRRFFHASVLNQHRSLVAAHTHVYLDRVTRDSVNADIPVKSIELKWAGYLFPNAVVRPGLSRDFDCCWVHHTYPSVAQFSGFVDSTEYMPLIQGPGRFRLRFTALADGFGPQSLDALLTLGATIDAARLVPMCREAA